MAPAAGGTKPSTAANPAPTPNGALAHLVIPRIGVNVYVVQGVSDEDLRRGPGHYPQTALPGQVGNAAIAGHRTTYGAPFYSLNDSGSVTPSPSPTRRAAPLSTG